MKVLVYVEGPSDRVALEKVLKQVIDDGRKNRVGISFHPLQGKAAVLDDAPRKAARHLADNPADWVFALPDLYPMSPYDETENQHRSYEDLRSLLIGRFEERARKLPVEVRSHFRVHCLKHDLEALLLAASDPLRKRLETQDQLRNSWRLPVENQNDQRPPKYVVSELFTKYRKRKYVDTVDAPWILAGADLPSIEQACPQRFAPFVAELRSLATSQTLML